MIDFKNATLLGYNFAHEFQDTDFRFGGRKNLSVQGLLLDLSNQEGISGIISGFDALRIAAREDYTDIIINGTNLGKGKITDISISEGNQVRTSTYDISLTVYDSGNLYNLTGDYYSGLGFFESQATPAYMLDSFSEDFNFDNGDDSFSFSRNISIQFTSGDNLKISPIERAKSFAVQLFETKPPFGFIDPRFSGRYINDYKKRYSETIDLINGTLSVTETFDSLNWSGDYSISFRQQISSNENGIVTVSEDGDVEAHYSNYRDILKTGLSTETSNSYSRCSGIFSAYYAGADFYPLRQKPISLSQNVDSFAGKASYSVEYSNDPRNQEGYIWTYNHSVDRDDENYFNITEDGNIQGIGKPILPRYEKALSGFNEDVSTGIYNRVYNIYTGIIGTTGQLYLIEQSKQKDKFNGSIQYTNRYSNKPQGESGIKKLEINVSDNIPVDLAQSYDIINGEQQIIQTSANTTQGSRSLSMNLTAESDITLSGILNYAKTKCNNYIPTTYNDYFISDCTYEWNKNDNIVDVNVAWNFNYPKRANQFV